MRQSGIFLRHSPEPNMPFIRNPNGSKLRASEARLGLTITQAYEKAYGGAVVKYRKHIQEHSARVWSAAVDTLGADEQAEWDEARLWELVNVELKAHAPALVLGFFREARASSKDAIKERDWGAFEAQAETLNPKWGIRLPQVRDETKNGRRATVNQNRTVEWGRIAASDGHEDRTTSIAWLRSDWLRFWEAEARLASPEPSIHSWYRDFWQHERDQKTLDASGWRTFWAERLIEGMKKDPRLSSLLARMAWREAVAAAAGGDWLLGIDTAVPGLPDHQAYLALALEHLQHIRTQAGWRLADQDLQRLVANIKPERDMTLSWQAWETMQQQNLLTPLGKGGARELPQWMWMRTAIALCQGENEFSKHVLLAYEAFSTGRIVPSEAMMRQAGKSMPQFMEDQAGWVDDDFERIYQAIHRAAVDTKWNGTVSLDWSRVRPKGSAAAAGRTSAGVVGFVQAISMALSAQGRASEERPVTILLPLWHGDVVHFMDAVDRIPHIQPTLAIPDLFFRRLREQGTWCLFDPSLFPEVLEGDAGILRAEERYGSMRKSHGKVPGVRQIKAQGLWSRLLRCIATHAPSLVFPSSVQAFFPMPDMIPVMGRDGIGAMPLPGSEPESRTRWPSLAVNLASLVRDDGSMDHDLMSQTADLSLRLLDNAIEISACGERAVIQSRPVCVGVIGLCETLAKVTVDESDAQLTGQWMEGIAKAWNQCLDSADGVLAKERGSSDLWGLQWRRPTVRQAVEKLRKVRDGELGLTSPIKDEVAGPASSRFSVRTLWAPFLELSKLAGVTPGGFGTLHPLDSVIIDGNTLFAPSAFLLLLMKQGKITPEQAGKVLSFPNKPTRWPKAVLSIVHPEQEQWRIRLHQVASLRPHVDQGVCLSLPNDMDRQMCAYLIYSSWWLGLSNVLFVAKPEADDSSDSSAADQELDA